MSSSSSNSSPWSPVDECCSEGAGEELAGVPLVLPAFTAGVFDVRDDGVVDLLGSTFRFFAGGAFFALVAVPFLVLAAGAGLFLLFAADGECAAISVEGMGVEDSRSGELWRRPCSFFSEVKALRV